MTVPVTILHSIYTLLLYSTAQDIKVLAMPHAMLAFDGHARPLSDSPTVLRSTGFSRIVTASVSVPLSKQSLFYAPHLQTSKIYHRSCSCEVGSVAQDSLGEWLSRLRSPPSDDLQVQLEVETDTKTATLLL